MKHKWTEAHPRPFQSMLTDDNGEWDMGNIGQFMLMVLVIGAIPFICLMALVRAVLKAFWDIDFPFDPMPVGGAIGAICGAFAASIGAWGAARRLADNKAALQPPEPAPDSVQQPPPPPKPHGGDVNAP